MLNKDAATWQSTTALHRRVEVQNRIFSEKGAFPARVFEVPMLPPGLEGLKFLQSQQKGPTAKAAYFGKIDFGLGGKPTENLLILSFIQERGRWLYDRADFVSLVALPAVRKELAANNLSYLKETPEAQASGIVPETAIVVRPAKYIAKVYVFCPGREVKVQINKLSHHRFANAQEAEIVIGGALEGSNEVQFAIKKIEGATGKEAMTIRVYLLSQVDGVQPIKIYEYQIKSGETPKEFGTGNFQITPETDARLNSK